MARADMFLKVVGASRGPINGESNDAAFREQIEVADWSWGMSAPTAVGGQRTARTQMQSLRIVKRMCKASTALMAAMYTNEPLREVVLSIRKASGAGPALPYCVIKLSGGRVDEYSVQADFVDGAPVLNEHVSIRFTKINIAYVPQTGTGSGGGALEFEGSSAPDV